MSDCWDKFAITKKVQVREKANPRWSSHYNNNLMTIKKKAILNKNDRVFTIGSCFAERIRVCLDEEGIKVGPPMESIPLDDSRYRIDRLPSKPHMNYFNTYTIRQEFERHIGNWEQSKDDYWKTKDPYWGQSHAYQDPYRRMVIGKTPEDLNLAVSLCDKAIDTGINESKIFFMTFGMAEVFINKKTGKIACQKPGYAGGAGENETEFYSSGFQDNYDNVSRTVEIIKSIHPDAQIVTTVSPVSLARTFSDDDILSANTEGKSILRSVLGQICKDYKDVTYFPSYEMVMYNSPESFRGDDGRHVNNWVVSKIVSSFKEAHIYE